MRVNAAFACFFVLPLDDLRFEYREDIFAAFTYDQRKNSLAQCELGMA